MLKLVRSGRGIPALAREPEASASSIRDWVKQTDQRTSGLFLTRESPWERVNRCNVQPEAISLHVRRCGDRCTVPPRPDMNQRYKIFGERNCGTNLLRHLLRDQPLLPDDAGLTSLASVNRLALTLGRVFPRIYDRLYDWMTPDRQQAICGWKHAAPSETRLREAGVTPVVIVKHPSFWMRSFLRRPFHLHGDASSYTPRRIEGLPREEMHIEEMYLLKLAAYRRVLGACSGILVQYETLVSHFEESRRQLVSIFGACGSLPEGDVRSFTDSEPVEPDYASRYTNAVLRSLDAFSEIRMREAGKLLSFFGYGVREWHKTLPRTL